jgi:hypothetical protein
MIADETLAKIVSDQILDIGRRLDELVSTVAEQSEGEEELQFRHAVGTVLGELLLSILNPLYRQHPALKPPELR